MNLSMQRTIRVYGEGIEVDISGTEPYVNERHIRNALGLSLFSSALTGVGQQPNMFMSETAGIRMVDLLRYLKCKAVGNNVSRRVLIETLTEWLPKLQEEINARIDLPTIRELSDNHVEEATIRTFLGFNNIELTDLQSSRMGKIAVGLTRGIPDRTKVSVWSEHLGRFIKRDENMYKYSVMTAAFKQLFAS